MKDSCSLEKSFIESGKNNCKEAFLLRVFAFVGSSGTGKSYRAQWIARENELDCIIDDGLLIKDNRILAGKSAKKEASRIASVKRAIFIDDNHAKDVIKAIEEENPKGILVLGTSDEMVNKIAKKLNLPEFEKTIYIEEVASEKEIEKARYLRRQLGKHVIPVPTVEIKNQFSGYFLNPLKIFKRKENSSEATAFEKTIVRPAFSYMGEYTISETVINSLIYNIGKNFEGVKKILKVKNKNTSDGVIIDVEILGVYGYKLMDVMGNLAERILAEVERITALNVEKLNIVVKSIYVEDGMVKSKEE